MDSIVSRLSEIETTAAAIVDHAQSKKDSLEKEMQEKRDKFDVKLETETAKKLARLQSNLEAKCSEILKSQEALHKLTLDELEEEFEQKHKRYAKEIFQRIIEG